MTAAWHKRGIDIVRHLIEPFTFSLAADEEMLV